MLELKHISKTFNPGTVNEKQALNDLSVTLEAGDVVTIVGSNGAGKSTLFNAVAGDFYTDEGSILLDGQDITYLPAYRRKMCIRDSCCSSAVCSSTTSPAGTASFTSG